MSVVFFELLVCGLHRFSGLSALLVVCVELLNNLSSLLKRVGVHGGLALQVNHQGLELSMLLLFILQPEQQLPLFGVQALAQPHLQLQLLVQCLDDLLLLCNYSLILGLGDMQRSSMSLGLGARIGGSASLLISYWPGCLILDGDTIEMTLVS